MAYRSSEIGTAANSTSHTIPVPTGLANGDKVSLFFIEEAGTTAATSVPTGFTLAEEVDVASGFRALRISRWWKDITNAAGEGSGGNYTITFGSAAIGYGLSIAHSGRATGAGTSAETNDGAGGASPLAVALNGVTAASGDDVIYLGCVAPDDDVDIFAVTSSWSVPTNYTSREENANAWRISLLAIRDNVSSGATGTLTGTCTYTNAGTATFGGLVVTMAATGGGGGGTDSNLLLLGVG